MPRHADLGAPWHGSGAEAWCRRPGDAGQAAVELALALPLVMLLLLALLQVVVVGRDQIAVVQAAREGARAGALAPDPGSAVSSAQAAARAAVPGLALARLHVDVAVSGDAVRVTVGYDAPTDVPLAGALVGEVHLSATVVMRREPDP